MEVASRIIPSLTINNPLMGASEGKSQAQTFGPEITSELRLAKRSSRSASGNPVPTNHIQILDQMKISR